MVVMNLFDSNVYAEINTRIDKRTHLYQPIMYYFTLK